MDFRLSEEQSDLVGVIKDFGKREVTEKFVREIMGRPALDRVPYAREQGFMRKLLDIGLKTLVVPEEYGGGGADLLTQCVATEAIAQYASVAAAFLQSSWKLCGDLAAFGTEQQKEWIFSTLASDPGFLMGSACTEPGHGVDPRLANDAPGSGLATFAFRDGDEYVINGEKCFIGSVTTNLLFVWLRTDKRGPLSRSMSCIMVPTTTEGYSVQRFNEFMTEGLRPNGDPLFDDVRVPVANLLGEENKGFLIWEGRSVYNLLWPASVVGEAQKIYELTKAEAKRRVQGGKPIYEHSNVGMKLAEMHSMIEDLRLKVYRTAWEVDEAAKTGKVVFDTLGVNLCAMAAHDVQTGTAARAAEIWGGRGALKDLPIEGYIRSAWGHLHEFGTPDICRIQSWLRLDGYEPLDSLAG
ncbi:acyl-CoA dehydrogenase family protein [Nocardia miyunensis]|uniref:acyl-CoA dehydrogenase family protein n=1 Tax=Nocardia miyunensis TaxID=282684 RepID=UPI00083606A0|nr:acyl-CoA dehydrogenase family protein [Nocardia miyunensis]